ncbi:PepSY-associated TM helix domain-containing protein [Methylocystis sp. 9N]|uniref:PepSY-associated TM helix domain-containing protein n=1 Tax=Methylocystis borbori TaxID=3118750 RepID=A0ABU7XCT1_9HYPH
MFTTLRQSMTWLHTWSGVTLGVILIVIFFMGALSVFDREIDRWMAPTTRLPARHASISLDALRPRIDALLADADQWRLVLPDARAPFLQLGFRSKSGPRNFAINPASGDILPDSGTLGATRFFYPFHYTLLIRAFNIGPWIVGAAAMAMLVLLTSGVLIRTGLFANFFTYRPKGPLLRASQDLHAVMGVIGLPFFFVIPLSGLVIFSAVYLPAGIDAAYPGKANVFFDEAVGAARLPKSGGPGVIGSLDAMRSSAERRWGAEAELLLVTNARDANAVIEFRRNTKDRVSHDGEPIFFDRAGQMLGQGANRPARSTLDFIWGVHLLRFEHWPLRWLYFVAGLGGCALIVTGFVIWLEKRKTKPHPTGVRFVEALLIAASVGLVFATGGFFVANRLLPQDTPSRAQWETVAFFALWAASVVHAGQRVAAGQAQGAWREQAWAVCIMAGAAPVLNWITTGDHLAKSLAQGQWAVAGVDIGLLAASFVAAMAARRLGRAGETASRVEPQNRRSAQVETDHA